MGKIVDQAELLRQVETVRAEGRTVVHCHGCFDMVHPGHVRYLEFAAKQGDLLVVSLTGDSQISKGDQRPYIPEELRAENLAALSVVNLVHINPHPTACELLAAMKPDIYVKGREYEASTDEGFAAERQIVAGYGGRVLFSSGDVVFSSSRLIEAISQSPGLELERLVLLSRRQRIDRESTEKIVRRFSRLRVLVVGDVVLDRYVFCDATDLASEAPMMSLTQQEQRVYVGGAGIVARHAAGLGAEVFLLSATGQDDMTRQVTERFAAERIHAHLVPCRPSLPQKTRYLVETTKLLRVEDGQSHPLDSIADENAASWVRSLAIEFDAVIFCDMGYGALTHGLLDRLYAMWQNRRPIIAANASSPRGQLLQFCQADLLCPSERQLRSALYDFGRGLASVAWEAMDRTQARQMIVTMGKKGIVAFTRQTDDPASPEWRGRLRSEYLPSLADHVVDPLGAGDALLATATLSLAARANLMQAAYIGSATAALECARLGNLPIDAETLARWLGDRIELAPSAQAQPRKPVRFRVNVPRVSPTNPCATDAPISMSDNA